MVYLIFKGGGWAGRNTSPSPKKVSREEELHRKIEKGNVTDKDISDIKKDPVLLKELDKKANANYKRLRSSTIYNDFRKGTFDGIDNDGSFYKDIPLDKLEK